MTIAGTLIRRLGAGSPKSLTPQLTADPLEDRFQRTLNTAWSNGLPPAASAIHARWWQLETWLRSLVYVELRAMYGKDWVKHLPSNALSMSAKDQTRHTYMPTPDATNLLAYLDVYHLFKVTDDYWDLFKPSLLDASVWSARVDEVKKIRHRIAHCRRPHDDDLNRLEQMLRDLDQKAYGALAAFNDTWSAVPEWNVNDPVLEAWRNRKHKDASIIGHALSNCYTTFNFGVSKRPWAVSLGKDEPVIGTPGYLWHARWTGGQGELRLREWWDEIEEVQDLIVYVCSEGAGDLSVSFAAVDDPSEVADAIGRCFYAALHNQGHRFPDLDEDWSQKYEDLDLRFQLATHWATVSPSTTPVPIF